MTSTLLRVPRSTVDRTIAALREAGALERELVVAWFGRRRPGVIDVTRCYVPDQFGTTLSFRVTDAGMRELRADMAARGELVAAQIHAHPEEAFHSLADDRGALVGHLGALSIVLPAFAETTTADSFLADAAVFRLEATGRWDQVRRGAMCDVIEVVPG